MATYVILHGMTAGGFWMKKVATRLRAAGHEVFTPSYTGLGERSHLLRREIDLETHILDVLQVLHYEDLSDVILVGKSYSGMVITAVADRVPERLRHVVYLDASLPEDGQSLVGLFEPDQVTGLAAIVARQGEGWFVPANPAVEPRLAAHPWQTLIDPIRLTDNPAAERIPRSYIYCMLKPPDSAVTAMTRRGAATARRNGWDYYEIETDHEPEQNRPDQLAEILIRIASRSGTAMSV
jgi:pimeloyl-ACP methyl ester carboxylesterase